MGPEETDALLERAGRLLEAGKAAACLECLDGLVGGLLEGEDQVEWASLRAWALTELGRDEEALELLDGALAEFPDSSRLLGTLGVVLSNGEDLEDACEALERAVDVNPRDEVALANLALVYEKLRDYPRAADLYDRALNLGADIDWVLQRKAAVLTEDGRYADAKATAKRYLSLVPEDAAQWIALGILHSDDEEYDEAFSCYQAAEKLEPESASLRLNWGVTAVRAQDLEMAYRQLAHLKEIEPRSTRWWLLRAFIFEEEGALDKAQQIYERALRRKIADRAELTYVLEMAMDFFSRQRAAEACAALLKRAYMANACTVELCEAYREAVGEYVERAQWFSVAVEADYRGGLVEVRDRYDSPDQLYTRFVRDFQVIARNHDEALSLVTDLTRAMGESNATVREFTGREHVADTHTGIYEVAAESFVYADDDEQ